MTEKHLYGAAATIVGTIIGAGILGIPYVISQTGTIIGITQIIAVGLLFMFLNLNVGEIILRTKGNHQLTGYAEKYTGKTGKILMTASMVLGTWIALVAYGIGSGQVLSGIIGWGDPTTYGIIVFTTLSIIMFFGINILENMEKLLVTIMLFILAIIFLQAIPYVNLNNLATIHYPPILNSFGVIFFAFLGAMSIVEAKEILTKNKKLLKKAIIIGMTIPIVIYSLFAFFVIGVTGQKTTEVATIGLGIMTSPYIIIVGNILALFTMGTSFLALGFALKEMFQFDYKIKKKIAWLMTITIPLIIVAFNLTGFIQAISIAGVLEGGIISTLIVIMALKAKKRSERKPEYTIPLNKIVAGIIITFFAIIIIHQIVKSIGIM